MRRNISRAHRMASSLAAGATAAVAAVGAGVLLDSISAARERRQLLARGAIRALSDRWTTVGGCRVYARVSTVAGRGRLPVVFVHGFGVSSSYFVPSAERLATEFAVYAPDLPGHGRSDTPAEALDVPRLADVLLAWMDAVGIGRAMLVGNSMGCQTVAEAAVRYPDRVDRLVLIGPTTDPAGQSVPELFRRLVASSPFERPSLIGLLAKDYGRMGPRLVPELHFMRHDRIERKLPLVKAPVLLIRGQHDAVAPQRWVDEAARLARARAVITVPRWGHAVHYSAAPQFVAAVLPFLREAVDEPTDVAAGSGLSACPLSRYSGRGLG